MADQSSGAKMKQESSDSSAGEIFEQSAGDDNHSFAPQFEIKPDTLTTTAPRSFATILEGLRTAEDSFYFMADTGPQSGTRFPIDGAQVIVGWDDSNERITFDPASIAIPSAIISKDWIGVMVQPQTGDQILLNQEPLKAAARLRNGDQLWIAPPGDPGIERELLMLTFHEPASLLVLDSLFPHKLPPPVLIKSESSNRDDNDTTADNQLSAQPLARAYFGYFTSHELLIMGVSTLLLAAVIFFILDNT